MIRKPVQLILCILFSIAILAACATPTPRPTITPIPPTPTQVLPTATLEPSPTVSLINKMPITELVSIASDGAQGNSDSVSPAISADGRYVTFSSSASNLVDDDTNGFADCFVHDRVTGETTLVSVSSDGTQGNNDTSIWSTISADGRYVAFKSEADNLVEGDTNRVQDCFVHDRMTGETTRVSVASDGTQANGACAYIGWFGIIWGQFISADGRYVAFHSDATNLVEGDTNGSTDIFVHDLVTGETTRVSVASNGTQGNGASLHPSVSADGRYVAFQSNATNLVEGVTNGGIYVHDQLTGETTVESVSSDGTQGNQGGMYPFISADGRYVAFSSMSDNLVEGDTNGEFDIFVHDRISGETTRVSVASDGRQGNADYGAPAISADGRYVTFSSNASNLVEGDTNGWSDVFVHDRMTGKTTLVSVSSDETQGNTDSNYSFISADGRYVVFLSGADLLVKGDTNGVLDIFVRYLGTGK